MIRSKRITISMMHFPAMVIRKYRRSMAAISRFTRIIFRNEMAKMRPWTINIALKYNFRIYQRWLLATNNNRWILPIRRGLVNRPGPFMTALSAQKIGIRSLQWPTIPPVHPPFSGDEHLPFHKTPEVLPDRFDGSGRRGLQKRRFISPDETPIRYPGIQRPHPPSTGMTLIRLPTGSPDVAISSGEPDRRASSPTVQQWFRQHFRLFPVHFSSPTVGGKGAYRPPRRKISQSIFIQSMVSHLWGRSGEHERTGLHHRAGLISHGERNGESLRVFPGIPKRDMVTPPTQNFRANGVQPVFRKSPDVAEVIDEVKKISDSVKDFLIKSSVESHPSPGLLQGNQADIQNLSNQIIQSIEARIRIEHERRGWV